MSHADSNRPGRPSLSETDRHLLDRLVETGFEPARLEPLVEEHRQRVEQLMNMFGLLESYPVQNADASLVDGAMALVDRYQSEQDISNAPLSAVDARLVNLVVDSEFDAAAAREGLTADECDRVDAIMGVFRALDDYPVEDADQVLLDATLARIDRFEDERAARHRFDAQQALKGDQDSSRWRLPNFISAAAIILLTAGVLWPMANYMRDSQTEVPQPQPGAIVDSRPLDLPPLVDETSMARFGPQWPLSFDGAGSNVIRTGRVSEDAGETSWSAPRFELLMPKGDPLIQSPRLVSVQQGPNGSERVIVWTATEVEGGTDKIWTPVEVMIRRPKGDTDPQGL